MKKIFSLLVTAALIATTAFTQQKNINEPIVINNFTIYENNTHLFISWITKGNVATNVWRVQRSTDSIQFTTIAFVLGNDPNQQGDAYAYKEKLKHRKHTKYYYRLYHVDKNNNEQISKILTSIK